MREFEQVTQVVLVFLTSQPAQGSPALFDYLRHVRFVKRLVEHCQQGPALVVRKVFTIRWHLLLFNPVKYAHPLRTPLRVREIKRHSLQSQSALGGQIIVAIKTVTLDKGINLIVRTVRGSDTLCSLSHGGTGLH